MTDDLHKYIPVERKDVDALIAEVMGQRQTEEPAKRQKRQRIAVEHDNSKPSPDELKQAKAKHELQKQTDIAELIESFCKQNKASREKMTAFVEQVSGIIQRPFAYEGRKLGRSATEEAQAMRKLIAERLDFFPQEFTVKDILHLLARGQGSASVDHSTVLNALRWHTLQGNINRIGYRSKAEGERGRNEVLWQKIK